MKTLDRTARIFRELSATFNANKKSKSSNNIEMEQKKMPKKK